MGPMGGCAIQADGRLLAWGDDTYGQLSVPSGTDFVSVDAGEDFFAAQRADGTVVAWGHDHYGSIVGLPTGLPVASIRCGLRSMTLILFDGSVFSPGDLLSEASPYGGFFVDAHSAALFDFGISLYKGELLLAPTRPIAGQEVTLRLRSVPANSWVYLCYSMSGAGPTPVGNLGLELALSSPIKVRPPIQADDSGALNIDPIMLPPSLSSATVYLQVVDFDLLGPVTETLSNPVALQIE